MTEETPEYTKIENMTWHDPKKQRMEMGEMTEECGCVDLIKPAEEYARRHHKAVCKMIINPSADQGEMPLVRS